MQPISYKSLGQVTVGAAVGLLLAAAASAQSLIQTDATFVAVFGDPVPSITGSTFGLTSTFDTPVIDESGSSLFRGRFTGAGLFDDRGLFYGSDMSNLALVIRAGEPAPGIPGATLNSTSSSGGPSSNVRLSPDGIMLWGSRLSGAGITSADDTVLYHGTTGAFSILAREGDPAPNTVGAVYSSSFSNPSQQQNNMRRGGEVVFKSDLSGGDVSGTTNNQAYFIGTPGAVSLLARKGDTVLGGTVIESLGFVSQLNDPGQFVYNVTYSQTAGSSPATSFDDKALWIYTPGPGGTEVLREGDFAPGTAGGRFSNAGNTWTVNVGANAFNKGGNALIVAELFGGDAVTGVNDRALYLVDFVGQTMGVRRGDPAPGSDGDIGVFNNSSIRLNNNDDFAFQATIEAGTQTSLDDTGIWASIGGTLHLVAREGDPLPDGSGDVFGNTTGMSMYFNDLGHVLFNNRPIDPVTLASTDRGLFAWAPDCGLRTVLRVNQTIEVRTGVFKDVNGFSGVQFNNGNCASLHFSHDGKVTMDVSMTDGTAAITTVPLSFPTSTFCTAKSGLACGTPSISATGSPSVSSGSGFVISAGPARTCKSGILVYNTSRIAGLPFQGGTLCVQPMGLRRAGSTNSMGTPGGANCDGMFSLDMNAFAVGAWVVPDCAGAPSGIPANNAAAFLSVAGTTVHGQYWGRDSVATGSFVSNGLTWCVGP